MQSLTIRFDDKIYTMVKKTAEEEKRSFNMQVNYLLSKIIEEAKHGKERHEA